MNIKAVALIFLVIFATTATAYLVGISHSQIITKSIHYTESPGIIQVDDDLVEPQKEIDTPGMPT
ncbi:MAG: hypothetical protein K6T73_06190 [Candidatus Bathyarchaeota archaeon]|nr:hypothetical protein [Candidatus Bathyarchaeota archaeon]